MENKALFLDRDGVINHDTGYVHSIKDFNFIGGIFNLCKKALLKHYLIIVITNQSGIGRGLYTLNDFNYLTNWMCSEFAQNDILITKVYHSPYHPLYGLGEYKRDHYTRKPHPGMVHMAAKDFGLNLSNSILIGDKYSDIQAGQKAGIKTNILFDMNYASTCRHEKNYQVIKDLRDAEFFL
jgi:D-glycero-D-manno-heptose 1,7-bisphosphate phosphatase